METKENKNAPDYERIADRIVKVLFENGVTYRESEEVLKYVCGKLWGQHVQDSV